MSITTFKRGGIDTDASSLEIEIEQVPEVINYRGSFLSPTGVDRVNFDNPNLNSIAQILDSAYSLFRSCIDIGEIVNSSRFNCKYCWIFRRNIKLIVLIKSKEILEVVQGLVNLLEE